MPSASLGSKHPAGESLVLKLRIEEKTLAEAKSALAEGETLSAMVREAIRKEIQRRKREKK